MGTTRLNAAAMQDWAKRVAPEYLPESTRHAWHALAASEAGGTVDLARFVDVLQKLDGEEPRAGRSWSVGLSSDYRSRGPVGRAVCGARTLGVALQRLVHYYPLVQDATSIRLKVDEATAVLSYRILDPDIWPRSADALYTLGLVGSLVRSVAGGDWREVTVMVEADARAFRGPLADVVQTQVVFNGYANGLRFPAAFLERRLNAADHASRRMLNELNAGLSRRLRQTPISDRARHVIFRGLARGNVDQDQIARELAVSSRTLRRKLAAENASFQDLLDECRMRAAALEFRISPKQSLSGMALKLGYSEHSSFSRAFTRWAGMSPHVFRETVSPEALH